MKRNLWNLFAAIMSGAAIAWIIVIIRWQQVDQGVVRFKNPVWYAVWAWIGGMWLVGNVLYLIRNSRK